MSKNNVHPDHYKVGGRDRQDDAAAARFVRAIAAKTSSRERPDRMAKGPYFQRPELAKPAPPGQPAERAQKKAGTAKKSGARKMSASSRSPAKRKTSQKASRTAKRASRKT